MKPPIAIGKVIDAMIESKDQHVLEGVAGGGVPQEYPYMPPKPAASIAHLWWLSYRRTLAMPHRPRTGIGPLTDDGFESLIH